MVFPHLDGRSPGREGARVSLDNLAGFARDPMTDWEDTTGWGGELWEKNTVVKYAGETVVGQKRYF